MVVVIGVEVMVVVVMAAAAAAEVVVGAHPLTQEERQADL